MRRCCSPNRRLIWAHQNSCFCQKTNWNPLVWSISLKQQQLSRGCNFLKKCFKWFLHNDRIARRDCMQVCIKIGTLWPPPPPLPLRHLFPIRIFVILSLYSQRPPAPSISHAHHQPPPPKLDSPQTWILKWKYFLESSKIVWISS